MDIPALLLEVGVLLGVGVALAMFGGGGAIILIPYLTKIAGVPLDEAVVLSLITIGINTGIKTWSDRRDIDWHAVILFSVVSFPTAVVSSTYLAPVTPDPVRMALFGVFTLTVAGLMLFPINQGAFSRRTPVALGLSALLTGVICGLIGVGGGIFIAPTLSLFWNTPIKAAVKASLAIVAVQSVAALLGTFGRGVRVEPIELVKLLVLIAVGLMLGKRLKEATSDRNLKSSFAVFLVLVGAWVLIRN
jgi:uncharacterized membrane protein YfcA